MTKVEKIYSHDEAARILDIFEDYLDEKNITLPSPEDDDRNPDNAARLYGSTYADLLDEVEDEILNIKGDTGRAVFIEPLKIAARLTGMFKTTMTAHGFELDPFDFLEISKKVTWIVTDIYDRRRDGAEFVPYVFSGTI